MFEVEYDVRRLK